LKNFFVGYHGHVWHVVGFSRIIWAFSAHPQTLWKYIGPFQWKSSEKFRLLAVGRLHVALIVSKWTLGKFWYFLKIFWIFIQNWILLGSLVGTCTSEKPHIRLKYVRFYVKRTWFYRENPMFESLEASSDLNIFKMYFGKILIFFENF